MYSTHLNLAPHTESIAWFDCLTIAVCEMYFDVILNMSMCALNSKRFANSSYSIDVTTIISLGHNLRDCLKRQLAKRV